MPGWVFPLYSREDFESLDDETPPGSLKDNLESVVLKAINAGFTQYIELADAKANTLAKLADFVSRSISSQSQSLNTGGPSKSLSF